MSVVPELIDAATKGSATKLDVNTGFTWTSAFTGGSFMALLGMLIRQVGPWRRQRSDDEQQLVVNLNHTIDTLTARLDKMERLLETERRLRFIEVRRLEARTAAQRSLDRHKFSNSEACLDSLLRIIELAPEKAPEAARKAREQRIEQRAAEHMESAQIHQAEMVAVELAEKELAKQAETEGQTYG